MKSIFISALILSGVWSLQAQSDSSLYAKILKPHFKRNSHNIGLGFSWLIGVHTAQKQYPGVLWGLGTNFNYSYNPIDYVSVGVQLTRMHIEHTDAKYITGYNAFSPYIRLHLPLAIFSPKIRHYKSCLFTELGYWEGSIYRNTILESKVFPGVMIPTAIRFSALSLGGGLHAPLNERWSLQLYYRQNFLRRGLKWKEDTDGITDWDVKLGLLYHFGKPHRPLVLGDK